MLSFQNNSNIVSVEREYFKLSFNSLNNQFSYAIQESLNILQLALCCQSVDFKHSGEHERSNAMA